MMQDKYISVKEKNKYYKNISDLQIKIHNEKFIQKKEKEYKNYFNNMFKDVDNNIKLDHEQIKAILTDEDYEMIIAGAGSGKTTTITGKVKYLVEKLKIKPEEIIIISYTNEAVNELRTRVNKEFKIPTNIYTFHKFCLDIIKLKKKVKVLSDNTYIFKNYFKENKLYYKNYLKHHNLKKYIRFLINKKVLSDDLDLCINFLNLFRTNNYNSFLNLIEKYQKDKKIYSFILLIQDIYNYYNNFLMFHKLIDFDGMIIECIKLLDEINLNYKYLIIDEYQDISHLRFKLISKIANLTDIKIIVVGDDFQSIYSFSGSDISLFVNFEKLMGYASILKITNTYRNSQELITIIGKFIMKNPSQIRKDLFSFKYLKNPIILMSYRNDKIKKLEKIILNIIEEYGNKKSILILGRYTYDINFISNSDKFDCNNKNKIIYKHEPKLNIVYMTIHASKGLGFDNVIIINNENGVYGFPTKVKDNKYLKIIKQNSDNFSFSEERRLFYVAITRTKNRVYLLYPKLRPSTFIKEIKQIIN